MRVARSIAAAIVVVAALPAGCGEDLGTCDMGAATTVVYSATDGTPFYAGQALIQYGCAEGVCHALNAEKDARKGAPHGLNFDVKPLFTGATATDVTALRDGIAAVRDEGGSLYSEIESGRMPPGKEGERTPPVWKLDATRTADLPLLTSAAGQSTVRNWLACGAPIVVGTTASADTSAVGGAVLPALATTPAGADFKSIYTNVLAPCATACHKPGGTYALLDLSSETVAYTAIVNKAGPATCAAAGSLVVPNSCGTSVLYSKLSATPECGTRMPQGGTPVSDANMAALCAWIDAGAKP